MPQKLIDQTTIQPDGRQGDDAFTAFATCNDNFEDAEGRLSALEGGSSNIGQDVADLKTGLHQETLLRTDADTALSQAVAAEVTARQNADTALGARFIGKNRLINGSMRWWQRGTSFTAPGYSVDRWYFNAGGVATPSLSRNTVTPGAFDTECIYLAKIAYGAVTDAANHYVVLEQRMENVTTLAGRTVTVSLKVFNSGAAGRQIAIEFGQSFGAGGSAQVSGIGAAKYSLATGINTVTHTVQIPSISGKTVGANNSLILTLWATGGSNFNARNASLGAQAGDVHFTQVQVEEGSSASAFEYRHDGLELALCQRFYCKSFGASTAPAVALPAATAQGATAFSSGLIRTNTVPFPVEMRSTPALLLYTSNDANSQGNGAALWNGTVWNSGAAWSFDTASSRGFAIEGNFGSGLTPNGSYLTRFNWTADAEI
ncbi:hypothetical protein [Stenotrophomonas pavanii]|uniref:hypothetical protein n=1 Tax=Stenotrophomonas pavanii TaxID=487698 RepID=UPI0015F745AA|nr:hypothetical protein [Stenotrophomonas pavanii]